MTTRWNAVLLLDESDVFLEQRSIDDLERNRVVSSKSSLIHIKVITLILSKFSYECWSTIQAFFS